MEKMTVLGFYKYVDVESPEELQVWLKDYLLKNEMMGRILVGREGINGSVSGGREQIDSFKEFLVSYRGFEDIFFKEESSIGHPFKKLKVLVRDEIVAFGVDVNLQNTGKHISGEELLELYD